METTTDINKFIAAFMGGKFRKEEPNRVYSLTNRGTYHFISLLTYHSSWDSLMPVWKKIGNLMFEVRGSISHEDYSRGVQITVSIMEAFRKVDIESAYEKIVEAIKWYKVIID